MKRYDLNGEWVRYENVKGWKNPEEIKELMNDLELYKEFVLAKCFQDFSTFLVREKNISIGKKFSYLLNNTKDSVAEEQSPCLKDEKVVEESIKDTIVSTQQSFFNTVEFKSSPEFFVKERDGLKPNTVRIIEYSDERFLRLDSGDVKFIRVFNTETNECFDREITDYSEWKGFAIISWKHPKGD